MDLKVELELDLKVELELELKPKADSGWIEEQQELEVDLGQIEQQRD